jgi:murein DD-endopeptidase MepM/ murein hydrolase activator NlpD
MKRKKENIKLLLSMVLWFGSLPAFTQNVQILDDHSKPLECVTEEQYQQFMKPALEFNIAKLKEEGKLNPPSLEKSGNEVKLAWPLRMANSYAETDGVYDGWYVGNFADLDPDVNQRLDWECNEATFDNYFFGGAKNYDGHNGADIVPYPFSWQMMDDESVDIIAAADGEVIHIYDANTIDRNCDAPHEFNSEPFNGGYYGNFVALLHDDGSITIYGHMKNGTVANLSLGDNVVSGQYLGKMGSSGNSSAPHIHFEVRLCESCSYVEPWYSGGGCNDDITESKWLNQTPYYSPQVLRVATHNALPVFKTCENYENGSNETVNFSNHFSTSEVLMISVAMRDFFFGGTLDVDIINSSGAILENMTWFSTDNYYRDIFLFTENLAGYATGTYKIRVSHNGNFYYHFFTVNCPPSLTLSGVQTGVKGFISGDNIASTASIGGLVTNDVLYQAASFVKLNVGFKAAQNCSFKAEIESCSIGGLRLAQEDNIEEESLSNQLTIFPNPANGFVNINFTSEEFSDLFLVIRNLMGSIIYQSKPIALANSIAINIDLSKQSKGIYLVELHRNNTIESKKLVLQ